MARLLDMTLDEVIHMRRKRGARDEVPRVELKRSKFGSARGVQPAQPQEERKVIFNASAASDLDAVVTKVVRWIQNNKSSRPRTQERLMHAVEKFCTVNHELDPELLFYRMLNANVIEVDENRNVVPVSQTLAAKDSSNNNANNNNNNDNNPNNNNNINDNTYARESYILATQRLCNGSWLKTLRPTQLKTFLVLLKTFATVKRPIPQHAVLAALQAQGHIQIDANNNNRLIYTDNSNGSNSNNGDNSKTKEEQ